MSNAVILTLIDDGHDQPAEMAIDVHSLVIAGWTGRGADAIEAHIAELEAIGVPRPKTVPCFYRVAASLLTSADVIEMPGSSSSGEVEFVLFASQRGMLVGVSSDHTDRHVETYSITVSKQMCAEPVATAAWRHADVVGHWDELILRPWAVENGERRLYQEGLVAAMRHARGFDRAPPRRRPRAFRRHRDVLRYPGRARRGRVHRAVRIRNRGPGAEPAH